MKVNSSSSKLKGPPFCQTANFLLFRKEEPRNFQVLALGFKYSLLPRARKNVTPAMTGSLASPQACSEHFPRSQVSTKQLTSGGQATELSPWGRVHTRPSQHFLPGEVWVAAVLAAADGGEVGERPVTGSGTGAGPPAASPSPFPARSDPGSR